jgi:hypothetical protein
MNVSLSLTIYPCGLSANNTDITYTMTMNDGMMGD